MGLSETNCKSRKKFKLYLLLNRTHEKLRYPIEEVNLRVSRTKSDKQKNDTRQKGISESQKRAQKAHQIRITLAHAANRTE